MEFIRQASKIVHEWYGHPEIFSRPQVIENSRLCLLFRTDIYYISQKESLGASDVCIAVAGQSRHQLPSCL